MSRTITVPDDLYAHLEREAAERGVTMAEMIAQLTDEVERARIALAIERMRREGLIVSVPALPADSGPIEFQPIQVTGKPLSEAIIEERR